jgi:hypothetical protein
MLAHFIPTAIKARLNRQVNRPLFGRGIPLGLLLAFSPLAGPVLAAPSIDTAQLELFEDYTEELANQFHALSVELVQGKSQSWATHLAPPFQADNWPSLAAPAAPTGWVSSQQVHLESRSTDAAEFTTAWTELLAEFASLEDMRFKIKKANYTVTNNTVTNSTATADISADAVLYFFVVGRNSTGQRRRLEGKAAIQAQRSEEGWRLAHFHFKEFSAAIAPRDLFNEVSLPAGVYREAPSFGAPGNQGFGAPGVALADAENDGDLDIVATGAGGTMLYLNNGDGTFAETGVDAGLRPSPRASGALFVDIDNDGDSDLFFAAIGSQMLFENRLVPDGRLYFVDVSADAGIDHSAQGYSATTADVNMDGFPDLYVASYNRYGTIMPNSWSAATNGTPNLLFVNQGDGTFLEQGRAWGVADSRWSYAAAFADLNEDGRPDLYVANDFGENAYYVNKGDRFADQASAGGLLDPGNGMGVACGDFDNDGRLDLHVTNMSSTAGNRILHRLFPDKATQLGSTRVLNKLAAGNSLFRNLGGGRFVDVSAQVGPFSAGWAFGGGFLDFDNDGWQDLHSPNGFISGKDLKDT